MDDARLFAIGAVLLLYVPACGPGAGGSPAVPVDHPRPPHVSTANHDAPDVAVDLATAVPQACILTAAGHVWCWGDVPLPGARTGEAARILDVEGARSLALGYRHGCALTGAGRLTCWGRLHDVILRFSPLRDGDDPFEEVGPTEVEAGDVVEIDGESTHTCVRSRGGSVWCTGDPYRLPYHGFQRINVRGARQIAVGVVHACALVGSGAECWGSAEAPWTEDTSGRWTGLAVDLPAMAARRAGPAGAVELAASTVYTCARVEAGGVFCWGLVPRPQRSCGPAPAIDRSLRPIPGVTGAQRLSAGDDHACALDGEGHAVCWGDNSVGQLGDGTIEPRTEAVRVALEGIERIAAGSRFTCALLRSGQVWCWGSDDHRQLGRRRAFGPAPGRVSFGERVRDVAVGGGHLCALLEGGRVRCLGDNDHGQLGRRGVVVSREPLDVGLDEVEHVAAADRHSCAVRRDGTVWCWGDDQHLQASGETGDDRCEPLWQPRQVAGIAGAAAVSVAGDHGCALSRAGEVSCWGENASGQLGAQGDVHRVAPVRGVPPFAQVSAGEGRTCARTAEGEVWCWGATPPLSTAGSLPPEPSPRPAPRRRDATSWRPARIELPVPVVSLAPGGRWTASALLEDGRVVRWHVPVPADRPPAEQPRLVDDPAQVALGETHVCVLDRFGSVACAEGPQYGQLGAYGDVTEGGRRRARIEGLPPAVSLVGGWATSCVLTAEGEVWCWGRPIPSFDPTPAPVEGLPR